MRLYLDSNVLISYLKSEIDGAFNLLGRDSEAFFAACHSLRVELVISELFLFEVKKAVSLEKKDIEGIFDSYGILTIFASSAGRQKSLEIQRRIGIHFSDAVHTATAIESNCIAIISWNKKDFEKARDLIKCLTPKEFISECF